MTTQTAVWTENIEFHASSAITFGNSETDSIDIAGAGYIKIKAQIWITFGTGTDGGVTVNIYSDSNSGASPDTIPLTSLEIPNTDSETKKVSISIELEPFVDIEVINNDGSESVTYVGKYSGMKGDSA